MNSFKGLKINNIESISPEELKQLEEQTFIFIDKREIFTNKFNRKVTEEVTKEVSRKRKKPLHNWVKSRRRRTVSKPSKELYWAEGIVNCRLNFEFELLFLVKWVGYPESQNTWQSVDDLFDCDKLFRDFYNSLFANKVVEYSPKDLKQLKVFLKDLKSVTQLDPEKTDHWLQAMKRPKKSDWYQKILCQEVSRQLGIETGFGDLYNFFKFCDRKKDFALRLNKWEQDINSQIKDEPKIFVENKVDFEIPPELTYLSRPLIDDQTELWSQIPSISCECTGNCRRSKCVCSEKIFHNKRFKTANVVYECNASCKCSDDCINKRIQRGRTTSLGVFKTEDRGWGLKTRKKMKKKDFIGEYVGQVLDSAATIGLESADYFFSIDEEFCGQTLFVDGNHSGNITRFANHSCRPNMDVHFAWVDGIDRIPRIAFFANRDILPDEELTYDYSRNILSYEQNGQYVRDDDDSDIGSADSDLAIKCLCGNKNCRQFI